MKKSSADARGHKTSMELPEELWRRAKVRAIDEPGGLRGVIVRALEMYLDQFSPAGDLKKKVKR